MAAAVVKEYRYILAVQPEPSTAADSSINQPILWKAVLSFLVACKNKHLSSAAVGRLRLPALCVLPCLAAVKPLEGGGCVWHRKMPTGYWVWQVIHRWKYVKYIFVGVWFFFSLNRDQEAVCRINIGRKNETKMDSEQKRGMQVLHVAESHRGMVLPCWWNHPHYSGACAASDVLSYRAAGGWCHWSQQLVLSPQCWVLGYSSVSLAGREVILCTVCINMLHTQRCCFSLSSYLHLFVWRWLFGCTLHFTLNKDSQDFQISYCRHFNFILSVYLSTCLLPDIILHAASLAAAPSFGSQGWCWCASAAGTALTAFAWALKAQGKSLSALNN